LQVHRPIFERIINQCREFGPISVAVVSPLSEIALTGAIDAARAGLSIPYLVGPSAQIRTLAREKRIDIGPYPIVDVADDPEAAERAVGLCRVGHAKPLCREAFKRINFSSLFWPQVLGCVRGHGSATHFSWMLPAVLEP
jgi:hypothetical protein